VSVSDAALYSATAHAFECGYAAAQADAPTERAAATGCTGTGTRPLRGVDLPWPPAGQRSIRDAQGRRWWLYPHNGETLRFCPDGPRCTSLDAVQAGAR